MRKRITTVYHRISHGLVRIVHGYLGSYAPSDTFFCTLLHLLEVSKVVFNTRIPPVAWESIPTLMLHSLLLCIVSIGFAHFDHLNAILVKLLEVITCVACLIWSNTHEGKILNNGVLKFLLFLGRVRIVESTNQSALVFLMSEVIVEQGSFRMADM